MDLFWGYVNEAQKMRLGHLTGGKAVFKLEWNGDFKPHTPIQHHTQSTKCLRLSFKTIQEGKCWSWGTTHPPNGAPQHSAITSWKSLIVPSLPDEWCHDELPKRHSKAALRAPVSSDCFMFVRPELCWEEMLWGMDSPAISTWARLLRAPAPFIALHYGWAACASRYINTKWGREEQRESCIAQYTTLSIV